MEKELFNKKLKTAALVLNILVIAALIFMEIVFYDIISYKKYLLLDYLPIKYIIFGEILFVVITIVPFVIRKGRKSTIVSIIMSAVLILAMVTVSVLGIVYNSQIKNMLNKADDTIDKIVENSQLATDEYGVYVLKENKAANLKDAAAFQFGYNTQFSLEESRCGDFESGVNRYDRVCGR